jgi:hypothetical protein
MNFEFTIDEDEFMEALRKIEITDAELMSVAGAGSAVIKTTQKLLVPVDTGATRASIAEHFEKGDAIASIEIGPSTEYAPYIEFGTSNPNYPIQPFVVPSVFGRSLTDTVKAIAAAFAMLVQSKWKR